MTATWFAIILSTVKYTRTSATVHRLIWSSSHQDKKWRYHKPILGLTPLNQFYFWLYNGTWCPRNLLPAPERVDRTCYFSIIVEKRIPSHLPTLGTYDVLLWSHERLLVLVTLKVYSLPYRGQCMSGVLFPINQLLLSINQSRKKEEMYHWKNIESTERKRKY